MWIYIRIYMYICTFTYVCIYVCMFACMYVRIRMHMSMCMRLNPPNTDQDSTLDALNDDGDLRCGWVFLERTRILSGIRFTTCTHFIECFLVETKRFVGSTVNVILTRQTCGQHSSRGAESKRWAPGNYFSERICYTFRMSKCRGDWLGDPGLCTFWVRAKRAQWRLPKKTCFARRKNRDLALRSDSLFASTHKVHRHRSQSPLHFDIRNI